MGLCKAILGKDIYDLQTNDLEHFFSSPKEESSVLEFKSSGTGIEKICSEVVAFLNTNGGLLILGAPKETEIEKGKKVCIGPLDPLTNIKGLDSLIQSIASNIAPAPTGIRGKEIRTERGLAFVLEIPQSTVPPHQASLEGKYYIRLEKESKAAPHGIVEALFQRRQRPMLGCTIYAIRGASGLHEYHFEFRNDGGETAEKITYLIKFMGIDETFPNLTVQQVVKDGECYTHQGSFNDLILVQGVTSTKVITLKPEKPYIYLSCTYWCMSGRAETSAGIFEHGQYHFKASYNSTNQSNEYTLEHIRDMFFDLNSLSEQATQGET